MNIIKASSNSVTEAVGAALARDLKSKGIKRAFVALSGDLGAGKTVFTTGFASVMSPGSRVKSPTYTIVNEYLKGEVPVYHFSFSASVLTIILTVASASVNGAKI